MDYQSLFNQYSSELESLKTKKAVLEAKIKESCTSLGINPEGDIEAQLLGMKADLEKKSEEMESQLKVLVAEVESIEVSDNEF